MIFILGGWGLGSVIIIILLFTSRNFYNFCCNYGTFFDDCPESWIFLWPMCLLVTIIEIILFVPSNILEQHWKKKSS